MTKQFFSLIFDRAEIGYQLLEPCHQNFTYIAAYANKFDVVLLLSYGTCIKKLVQLLFDVRKMQLSRAPANLSTVCFSFLWVDVPCL